ncbi:uncharacterized protein E0L32_008358 [Thyridium curvatum]|uniref:Uncharacterized protein n=1 Tax=Thyridium curvatum TaxID=1093900 RepID=A0A507AVX0_9PEZI|nr:uncharacterized protein E0L32_008358 [Thyridium curvatum]TPX10624.1 hypothetical protein E0L32_008358 [Thyridium curvatum]
MVENGDVSEDQSMHSLGAHPPAPVRPGQDTVQQRRPAEEISIDNRPVRPSSTDDPSEVLAADRPVVTSYLMSLTGHNYRKQQPTPAKDPEDDIFVIIDAADIPKEAVDAVRHSSIAQMEVGVRQSVVQKLGKVPCYRLTHQRNDMIVIGSVVLFVVVILLVETWDAMRESGRCLFGRHRQGQIRLDTEESAVIEKRALSIKASSTLEATQ